MVQNERVQRGAVGYPREDLDVLPRSAANRDREPEVPTAWSSRGFRQHLNQGEVPGDDVDGDRDYSRGGEEHR